jgi:quercetin dioxygenase-like cupin family protein
MEELNVPFWRTAELTERTVFPGFHGRFVHGDGVTMVYWRVEAGAVLPEHSHPHEQVSNVITGRFEMTIGGETSVVEAGDVAVIPSNVLHSARALSDCTIIDAFQPVREDYRAEAE